MQINFLIKKASTPAGGTFLVHASDYDDLRGVNLAAPTSEKNLDYAEYCYRTAMMDDGRVVHRALIALRDTPEP